MNLLLLSLLSVGLFATTTKSSSSSSSGEELQQRDTFEVMERLLSQTDPVNCTNDTLADANFIHIDVSISAYKKPRELWCFSDHMDAMEDIIQEEIHAQGMSGNITDDSSNPVVFDAVVCSDYTGGSIINRRLAAGGKEGLRGAGRSSSTSNERQRQLQYGWPFNTGAGGGCYSCSRENCDDDTGRWRSRCGRRRELFGAELPSEASFAEVKEVIEEHLEATIHTSLRSPRVECFQNLTDNQLFVTVNVTAVTLMELGCS
uniref:Uncharacterized protein n=1 Tax=Grammatophora oceanica TaxID=210454 RepID=A0A7S1Y841_9STRA